jgi:hypothetical protein
MKLAVILGSVLLAGVLAGIPLLLNGFSTANLGDWFFNAFFLTAVFSFIGMRFIVNERHSSSSPRKRRKK